MKRITKIELECVVAALGTADPAMFESGTGKREVARAQKKRLALASGIEKLKITLAARDRSGDANEAPEAE